MNKELEDLILLLRDAVGELDYYSAYHDDELSEEVSQLLLIVKKIEDKYE